jgi:hypothetical protein
MRKWLILCHRLLAPAALAATLAVSVAVGEGVSIVGPNQLDPKEADLFNIEGITSNELAKCCKVYVRPEEGQPQVSVFQTLDHRPVLFVKGRDAGTFEIILDVNKAGAFELVFHALTIGRDDDKPDPPIPPVPGDVATVVIIEEQEDRRKLPRSQLEAMADMKWRGMAEAKGLKWRLEDDDLVGPNDNRPKWLGPILSAINEEEVGLPVVCLVDSDGSVLSMQALPETVEEMRELVGGIE